MLANYRRLFCKLIFSRWQRLSKAESKSKKHFFSFTPLNPADHILLPVFCVVSLAFAIEAISPKVCGRFRKKIPTLLSLPVYLVVLSCIYVSPIP